MNNYTELYEIIKNMNIIAKALGVEPFPIYFLGGSACILGKYSDRLTRDFDIIDLNYPAKLGMVLRYLSDFDMLEYESTLLSPTYQKRALRLHEFDYLEIFVLSREDIVVSKIVRMEQKDIEDMQELMPKCDKKVINIIINEILNRNDLFDSKKKAFLNNLAAFKERYDV
ncbi:UNVERIFIED_CONTAM: hypothetical protein Cloal_2208 [Acetivibrio alkalicellulosi]